jgi:pimeloyl-ACP methyl ester carboxylesterase
MEQVVLHTTGAGPGIIVLHGGGVTIDIYRRLAAALAGRFTVHLYNRRGRGDAPPRSQPYTLQQDVDDLAAVMERTGTRNVLAHSGGGLVALQASLDVPVDRLALYDAVIPVAGTLPFGGWLDDARAAARDGDIARALALTGAGLNTNSAAVRLPLGAQTAMCRAYLRTPYGRMMGGLLPSTLDDCDEILRHEGPASRWSGTTATEVLLARGANSAPYYGPINEALAEALPRARSLRIPRSGHDAINRARRRLVRPLAEFFASADSVSAAPRGSQP